MLSLRSFLCHIWDESAYILRHTEGLTKEQFTDHELLPRAMVRSLEIIGEATKKLPHEFRASHPQIEWRAMAGMRDQLIHHYFGVDWEVVWDVITTEIPELHHQITNLLKDLSEED